MEVLERLETDTQKDNWLKHMLVGESAPPLP